LDCQARVVRAAAVDPTAVDLEPLCMVGRRDYLGIYAFCRASKLIQQRELSGMLAEAVSVLHSNARHGVTLEVLHDLLNCLLAVFNANSLL
jgi:hypothetical protein